MFTDALPEFRADWLLSGKAASTVGCHLSLLRLLADKHDSPCLADVRVWAGGIWLLLTWLSRFSWH